MNKILFFGFVLLCNFAFAQKPSNKAIVTTAIPTVSQLQPVTTNTSNSNTIKLKPNFKQRNNPKFVPAQNIHYTDVSQQTMAAGSNPNLKTPSVTIGVNTNSFNSNGVFPPDPTGDIGLNHYVHAINDPVGSTYRIYNKLGVQQGATFVMNTLGNTGGSATGGDPVIVYDEIANRWILTEFDDNTDSLFISVSTTSSPTGTFNTYRYKMPSGFPDYPKYAVWSNAYVCGVNDNNGSIVAFNRTNMLAGTPAQMAILPSPSFLNGFGFQVWQPIDIDGDSLNSTNTPMPLFIRHNDDESHVGSPIAGQDFLQLYQFNINWASPASSTFTQVANIAINEFDSDLCGLTGFNCIKQLGTTTELDPLREVVMNKPSYRRFANYESIVCCFSTDVNGADRAGIRWVELRKVGSGNWTKYQEGTYAPTTDALSRWMPAIAQDKNGNIALAYSVSSSSTYPSLRLTGRKSCDSLGIMTLPENQFATSNNNQASVERWGDYFQMSVDPVDDETFWFVGEYINGSFWDTRILSFKFNPDSTNISPTQAIIPSSVCGTSTPIKIVIKNTGVLPITTATVRYKVNTGSYTNYAWTGTLAANATDTITVNMNISAGVNNFTFVTSQANGAADNYRCDDTLYKSLTITVGGSVSATINATNITCNNLNNGIITVTPTSGSSPYLYAINSGTYASSNTFTNLTAGTYTLSVQDASGCSGSVGTATIINPTAITQSLTSVNICPGGSNGSIVITSTGGSGAYQYSLNGSSYQTSNIFNTLGAGTYTVYTKDANNCTKTGTATVATSSTALVVNGTITNATCNGGCNGAVTISTVGGTPPYTTTPSNINLCAGTYTFNIVDANSCSATYSATITQPTAISITVNNTVATCGTTPTGSIDFSATGGTGSIQYQLNSGALQSSGLFTSLISGIYTLTAVDANGCSTTSTVSLNGGQYLGVSVSTTSPLCNGLCSGLATVTGSNAGGTIMYELNNQGFLNNGSFNSLCAGTYTFTVKDMSNSCTNATVVTITEPNVLDFTTALTHPLCHNNCNGSIAITAIGGTPNYQYRLNLGAYTTNSTFNNICSGIFTLTVKDANNCSLSTTVTLTNPPTLVVSTVGDTICAGTATGTITINQTGGTPSYTYASSTTGTYQTANTFNNMLSGVYTVIVKDANNCTRTKTVTISSFAIPTITTSIINNKCSYDSLGILDINVVTGVAPFQYNIDNGPWQTSDTFINLANGTYQILILDSMGCESAYVANVSSPAPLVINATGVDINCYDADDGIINLAATGGTPGYIYAYNTSPYQSTTQFAPLAPSTYTLYVKDTNNCIDSTTVTLTEPTNMYFDSVSTTPNTSGNNATIFVQATGGTPNYQYNINNGPLQTGGLFSNLAGGSYTVMVTDANGCTETRIFKIDFPTNIKEVSLDGLITLYPNPAEEEFYIHINSDEPLGELNLRMYDMLGQQVTQATFMADQKEMTKKIELEEFAKAHYTIVITDKKNRSFVMRIVIKD